MANRILSTDYHVSNNFWESDGILRRWVQETLSNEAVAILEPKAKWIGGVAATQMDEESQMADRHPPELVLRNWLGEETEEVRFHPSYTSLLDKAIKSGMFSLKWDGRGRSGFSTERHKLGFVPYFLFSMAEGGLPCPLCMTDGAARLIRLFGCEELKSGILPHISTERVEELFTGAMFLTEKQGGSDVGTNEVVAKKSKDGRYKLFGEKWFCSNVNAEVIFALARTGKLEEGIRGLSLFLIQRKRQDGTPNRLGIRRLKDKLGVRSMASAECVLDGTEAILIGSEGQGFKLMTEMINLSRLYNSVAAISFFRRAQIESWQWNRHRTTFGEPLLEHSLMRWKWWELSSLYRLCFTLTMQCVDLLDKADNGCEESAQLLRFLTPLTKKFTAETAVYAIREHMELMGGIGYIEDGVMPKLLRDVLVLPIWEGSGNIMILDMLRAHMKGDGLRLLMDHIGEKLEGNDAFIWQDRRHSVESLANMTSEQMEWQAKLLFEQLPYWIGWSTANMPARAKSFYRYKLFGQAPDDIPSIAELESLIDWSY